MGSGGQDHEAEVGEHCLKEDGPDGHTWSSESTRAPLGQQRSPHPTKDRLGVTGRRSTRTGVSKSYKGCKPAGLLTSDPSHQLIRNTSRCANRWRPYTPRRIQRSDLDLGLLLSSPSWGSHWPLQLWME